MQSNASIWASPESVSAESGSVAVAVNDGSNSQRAIVWVLDGLVSQGQTITLIHVRNPIRSVPTPMGNYIPISQVSQAAARAYSKQVEAQTEEMLIPYRRLCEKKQVQTEIKILEDCKVADAIVKYVSESDVSVLVMGSSSRNALARRIRAPDVPAVVAKTAPEHCILYIVSKDKLSHMKSTVSSTSARTNHVGVHGISSSERDISNSSTPSNKSPTRDYGDPDAYHSDFPMVQSIYQRLSFRKPLVSRNIFKPENAALYAGKMKRSQSSRIGLRESSTTENGHLPIAPNGTKLSKSRSVFRRKLSTMNKEFETVIMLDVEADMYSDHKTKLQASGEISKLPLITDVSNLDNESILPMNEESETVSMLDVETHIYSDHKTELQASGEISKLPLITDVSNPDNENFLPRHVVLSNKIEIVNKDQSSSDFQHNNQNSKLESSDTNMEEITISMKRQIIADPSEIEYTKFSSSPKVSEDKERHALNIFNSEGSGYSEEHMELRTSATGHCGYPSMAESSHQNEMFFEFSFSELEAHRDRDISNSSSSSDKIQPKETGIYSDHTTGLPASAEISKLNEVMNKDQSDSDFQHDKHNSRLETFGIKMEESTISMKSQIRKDPIEIEYTQFSSSPKVSKDNERHSLVILNSEGRGYSEENMELGHCGQLSMAESELFFEFSLSEIEASRERHISNPSSASNKSQPREAGIYSDHKTGLQASAVVSELPSITDVSNPDDESLPLRHGVLFNKNEVLSKDQSNSGFSENNVEAGIYSDFKTGLQSSAEVSELPSITDVSNPDNESFSLQHGVLCNKNEVMYKDQSNSDFQHDKQNPRLEYFGTEMEERTISMKTPIIGDLNSEGTGYFEENMELRNSPTGHRGGPSMPESSHQREKLFEFSLLDSEAGRPQINIASKSLDCAILNIKEDALKLSQDMDERSASGETGLSSSSSGTLPKKVQVEQSCKQVGSKVLELLASENDHTIDLVEYPYARMDWKGCSNILFSQVETINARDVEMYVREVPPQQDEEMAKVDELLHVQRLGIPHSLDHIFRQQMMDHICALMARHKVVPVQATEIMQDPELKLIFSSLPPDMTILMCHVVGALKLLEKLRACHQSSLDSFVEDNYPQPPTSHLQPTNHHLLHEPFNHHLVPQQ